MADGQTIEAGEEGVDVPLALIVNEGTVRAKWGHPCIREMCIAAPELGKASPRQTEYPRAPAGGSTAPGARAALFALGCNCPGSVCRERAGSLRA
jgi:hypothetical protein